MALRERKKSWNDIVRQGNMLTRRLRKQGRNNAAEYVDALVGNRAEAYQQYLSKKYPSGVGDYGKEDDLQRSRTFWQGDAVMNLSNNRMNNVTTQSKAISSSSHNKRYRNIRSAFGMTTG